MIWSWIAFVFSSEKYLPLMNATLESNLVNE